jgi:hypothetical protein
MSDGLLMDEVARMQLQAIYTMNDYMECPELRQQIVDDFQINIDNTLRPVLEREVSKLYHATKATYTNVLECGSEGMFVGQLVGLLMSHIKPQYTDNVVHITPRESLAYLESHFEKKTTTIHQKQKDES